MPLDDDRLAAAAAFVTALFDLSRHSPRAWRRSDAVGRSAGIVRQQFERAARMPCGPVWSIAVDDGALVLLTSRGRAPRGRSNPE